MNELEHVGALYIETRRLVGEYQKLLELLQRAKDGDVPLDQIEIDLPASRWAIVLDAAAITKPL